ncbi:MAG: putative phosphoribosyltransferase, partial [Candidatus Gottesmanbacteria bacterium GW2011_GWB1_44_11c]
METQYLPIDWTTYHDLTRKLAASILSHASKIDQIVAISRGGLSLGHILSDFLRIPVATFTIQSYTDIQNQGEIKIIEPLKSPIRSKHILLCDDVSDTGKTFRRALVYLKRFKPERITTVSMFYKPHSVYRPDFFAKETSKWILFPYEPTEMILAITKSMEKEGKSKADIQKKLMSLG